MDEAERIQAIEHAVELNMQEANLDRLGEPIVDTIRETLEQLTGEDTNA